MRKYEDKRYRSPEALWRVVRQLPERLVRVIRRRQRDTRLGWLFEVLRGMETHDAQAVERLFGHTFPDTKVSILRVYKKQLWDLIEEVMAEEVGAKEGGWQAYKRMLASFRLWMMGEYETAFVLWRQAMEQAIQAEAYEVALRGLLGMELYMRDLHWVSHRSEAISDWIAQIMKILDDRYQGLIRKVMALERYILTRRKQSGMEMPALPTKERWGSYFGLYAEVIEQVQKTNFLEAIRTEVGMIETIFSNTTMTLYEKFQLSVAHINLLILLLNYRERSWFGPIYELWQIGRDRGIYPEEARFEALHRLSMGVRLARYIQEGDWGSAYSFLKEHEQELRRLVLHSLENIGLRLGIGVSVCWLTFQFFDKNLCQIWLSLLEDWIRKEGLEKEVEQLWYELLLWYMAQAEGYARVARYQVKRLRLLWKTYHPSDRRWYKLILITKFITDGSFQKARSLAKTVLEKHQTDWHADESTFPVIAFLEVVQRGRVLYPLSSRQGMLRDLPDDFQEQLDRLARRFEIYMKMPPGTSGPNSH